MDLTFEKQGSVYVSEFTAESDFNLHIEKGDGYLEIKQRTSGGKYDHVKGIGNNNFDPVIDLDFTGLVYPKTIRVECHVQPSVAIVTSEGEVAEVKTQEKEIEVTANGTTEVTPDAGYAYLSKVSVKTDVASEGGSGESSIEYLDTSVDTGAGSWALYLLACFINVKRKITFSGQEVLTIMPIELSRTLDSNLSNTIQGSIDFSGKIFLTQNEEITSYTVKQFLIQQGATEEQLAAIPRITKEEFYTL